MSSMVHGEAHDDSSSDGSDEREEEEQALISTDSVKRGFLHEAPVPTVPPPHPHSFTKLAFMTVALCGVQFCWACQNTTISAYLLSLGMSEFWVSYVWLISPMSGIIVQPVVGVISDRCTSKFGRRRPFMIAGTAFIVFALLLISNSQLLGELCGDKEHDRPVGITLAVLGLALLDLNINTLQGPCRTLLVDLIPYGPQLSTGNAFFSFWTSFGTLLGALVGSFDLVVAFPFAGSQIRALYTIAALVVSFTVLLTVRNVHEVQYIVTDDDRTRQESLCQNVRSALAHTFRTLKILPRTIKKVCAVQFFVWYGFFTIYMWGTAWVGSEVYGGDPDASEHSHDRKKYDEGVRWGSLAVAVNAFIALIYSPFIPRLMRCVGSRTTYFFSTLIMGIALMAAVWLATKWGAIVVIGLCGFSWGAAMSIPYVLVGDAATRDSIDDTGLFMATMNLFLCFPEILCAFTINLIVEAAGGNLGYALFAGGIATTIGAFLIPFLDPYSEKERLNDTFDSDVEQEVEVDEIIK